MGQSVSQYSLKELLSAFESLRQFLSYVWNAHGVQSTGAGLQRRRVILQLIDLNRSRVDWTVILLGARFWNERFIWPVRRGLIMFMVDLEQSMHGLWVRKSHSFITCRGKNYFKERVQFALVICSDSLEVSKNSVVKIITSEFITHFKHWLKCLVAED